MEVLAHASGRVPGSQAFVEIEIPAGLSIEEVTPEDVPHWNSPSYETARAFGDRWYDERCTPVLIVPSMVTLIERDVLIHQGHPDSARMRASKSSPVRWDARLWRARK